MALFQFLVVLSIFHAFPKLIYVFRLNLVRSWNVLYTYSSQNELGYGVHGIKT
jgi:hypothetical protein